MAPFACPNCARLLHFEARVCPACTFTLGYDPTSDAFLFLGNEATQWLGEGGETHEVVVCANNNEYEVCNWLVADHAPGGLCLACRHNRTIPDLTGPDVPARWAKIEAAKRRMFHTLLRLKLPIETQAEAAEMGTEPGLAFDFLYDPVGEDTGTVQITTGHEAGLITLNLLEADDAQREKMRHGLNEPYRTLLGHFRHEVGHYYWARLVENSDDLQRFRDLYGDETMSYEEAKSKHYGSDGGGWTTDFVSAYATMHPWEDFAETFAHYLHIVDALATLRGFGIKMEDFPGRDEAPEVDFNPYKAPTRQLVSEWLPFAFAENSINRSMGQQDLYPFHLSPAIEAKMDYINGLLHRNQERANAASLRREDATA